MRLLLDTHTFLWWADDSQLLSANARQAIENENNDCFVSLVSCWEIAIKVSLGKLALSQSVDTFVREQIAGNGFQLLPIDFRHITGIERLPFHHRDPFDRLLVAQAMAENLVLVTADSFIPQYDVTVLW